MNHDISPSFICKLKSFLCLCRWFFSLEIFFHWPKEWVMTWIPLTLQHSWSQCGSTKCAFVDFCKLYYSCPAASYLCVISRKRFRSCHEILESAFCVFLQQHLLEVASSEATIILKRWENLMMIEALLMKTKVDDDAAKQQHMLEENPKIDDNPRVRWELKKKLQKWQKQTGKYYKEDMRSCAPLGFGLQGKRRT